MSGRSDDAGVELLRLKRWLKALGKGSVFRILEEVVAGFLVSQRQTHAGDYGLEGNALEQTKQGFPSGSKERLSVVGAALAELSAGSQGPGCLQVAENRKDHMSDPAVRAIPAVRAATYLALAMVAPFRFERYALVVLRSVGETDPAQYRELVKRIKGLKGKKDGVKGL